MRLLGYVCTINDSFGIECSGCDIWGFVAGAEHVQASYVVGLELDRSTPRQHKAGSRTLVARITKHAMHKQAIVISFKNMITRARVAIMAQAL